VLGFVRLKLLEFGCFDAYYPRLGRNHNLTQFSLFFRRFRDT